MAETTLSLDPRILQANLAALNRTSPRIGATLAEHQDALRAVVPAAARDGSISLRVPGCTRPETWLGRSSIPRIRAQALVERFEPGEANILLPGIGEGSEAALFLKRLSPHRAVFVWERDPTNLLFAFALHDYTSAIDAQRLVPLIASEDDLLDTLLTTLRALPGHLCPDRILVWPWQRPSDVSGCRSSLETAYRQIEAERRDRLAQLRRELDAGFADAPRVRDDAGGPVSAVLFSIHCNEETWAWTDALASAAQSAGWRLPSIVVRTPADIHSVARAERMRAALQSTPTFAMLLDVCRSEVSDVLPETLPAVSWLTREPAGGAEPVSKRLGPRDRLIVTNSRLRDRLRAAGIESPRLAVRPLPVPPECEQEPPGWSERPADIAVVSHLWSTAAQAHGFDLPTHVKLWNAAIELLKQGLDRFADDQAARLLERAESSLRMRLEDPEVRAAMLNALAGPVASSLILRNLTQDLVKTGLTVDVHGEGWPELTGAPRSRSIPGPAGRLEIYRRAKCVLIVSPTGLVGWDVLLAAAAGAAVVWRAHPADRDDGGFAQLLAPAGESLVFRRNQEAAPAIRKLLNAPDTWRNLVRASWDRSRRDHSAAAALAALRAAATSLFPQT